ncbi:hypothetical protein BGC31_10275 [Komagataeibacter xylinus]|nr:hypothetical protein BGC31_10275 [Komagataeibacter xylinus]RFP04183.1 hypothetical protein BFX83_08890 [Komagataeibacter xylinus]
MIVTPSCVFHAARIRGFPKKTEPAMADIDVADALSGNFFVKNVVLKHIFVVIMPLCSIRVTYSGLRIMRPLLLSVLFNPL